MILIPNHVAIIMDGNGRWGIKKKGNRFHGHKAGIENIKRILNFCIKKKIKIITLYSFSFDNWKRKKKEIKNIFLLFKIYYKNNISNFKKKKIKIKIIGENKFLPRDIVKIKKKINNDKISNFKLKVNIAFNYSSKLEILNAVKKIKVKNINSINKKLYTYPDPDPDFIIRTGNTKRLSDFLLWQSSYSEIFFLKKLWPDFSPSNFNIILKKFNKVQRNYGSS